MRRLYQKIYLTIIASLLLVVLVAGGIWRWAAARRASSFSKWPANWPAWLLPAADAPRSEQQRVLEQLAQRFRTDLALFTEDGTPIAAAGRPLPPPPPRGEGGWAYGMGGAAWSFRLPDDRMIVVRAPGRHRHPAIGLVLFLGGIALAVALAAYPVVRGLTRRLERPAGWCGHARRRQPFSAGER